MSMLDKCLNPGPGPGQAPVSIKPPPSCENCRFFYTIEGVKPAFCRRRAPVDRLGINFPETSSYGWCGEYEQKEWP